VPLYSPAMLIAAGICSNVADINHTYKNSLWDVYPHADFITYLTLGTICDIS
jgi:hypothetical protein